MSDCLYLLLDASSVVVGSLRSPDPQPDSVVASQNLVLVDQPTYDAGRAQVGLCQYVSGALQPYAPPAPPVPQPYLTGGDVIDGMSPAQAAAQGVDVRDLVRIQAAPTADTVKSKVARVAKALGMTSAALLAQATPTGGL